ncbi:hypothetical protein N7466_007409 [Penicillium verhagenii]|uniref:uncharacterized protein n=1 Tax=Penicillium verhagenii TaxID=1562060 RepID=UPI002544D301|nr:uncharacterized protein N7466_007409 [Penicillium verhagenii]KAJ5928453.1 hypothetical protein N7466_007409 [Penicillium verhagenii]
MTIEDQLTPFGKPMLKHWLFDPSYKNLNHGSFGAHPVQVRDTQRALSAIADKRPDPYIRVHHLELLKEARAEIAELINAPQDECVFLKNATTGVWTVLYNLNLQESEALIYFGPVYGAVEMGIVSLQEHSPFQARKVPFEFPISVDELESRFREAVRKARVDGLKVRAAVFDSVVSNPGIRFPFERFVAICREEGILSIIDGAHGVGMIPLDMKELQPDFFVSNCHKWLYTPRSAAVLYVPKRNQHLIRTTLPTSWGFIAAPTSTATVASVLQDKNAPKTKTPFEELFEFVATSDDSAYICVPAALKFRREVCGGEKAIMSYCTNLANEAADLIAATLGTDVMQEPDLKPGEKSRMRDCCMVTIRLPLRVAGDGAQAQGGSWVTLTPEEAPLRASFIEQTLMKKFDTFVPVFRHGPWLWTRVSGQVFLEIGDFEWLAGVLRNLCEEVVEVSRKNRTSNI